MIRRNLATCCNLTGNTLNDDLMRSGICVDGLVYDPTLRDSDVTTHNPKSSVDNVL